MTRVFGELYEKLPLHDHPQPSNDQLKNNKMVILNANENDQFCTFLGLSILWPLAPCRDDGQGDEICLDVLRLVISL